MLLAQSQTNETDHEIKALYFFLKIERFTQTALEDKSQQSHETGTVETEQYGRRQRQPNLNAWLKAEGSQMFKRQQKK